MIKIRMVYTTIDGVYKAANYTTVQGARNFAQKWLGDGNGGWLAEIGGGGFYAISYDGIGRVDARGINMKALWEPIPAAACKTCGGWTEFGGMSQHYNVTDPQDSVLGRVGCVCNKGGK